MRRSRRWYEAPPLVVNVTVAPATGAEVTPLVTVAFREEVVTPSAAKLDGVAVRLTLLGTAVCVMSALPVVAPLASTPVTVQVPAVVEAV